MRLSWLAAALLGASVACSADDGPAPFEGDSAGGDGAAGDGDAIDYSDYDAPVTIGASCPGFAACGGDISGRWYYTSVCHVEAELFAKIYEGCAQTQVSQVVPERFRGWVEFQGGVVSRDIDAEIKAHLSVPTTCTFGFCDCAAVQSVINQNEGLVATCAAGCATGGCECDVTFTLDLTSGGTYTLSGSQVAITTSTNAGTKTTTYDYCAAGRSLTYEDAATTDKESGVYTLAR